MTTTDPLLDIFTTFGALHGAPVSSSLSIVPFEDLGSTVVEQASRTESHLILVPWLPPHYSIGAHAHDHSQAHQASAVEPAANATPMLTPRITTHMQNPFEALFRATAAGAEDREASILHSQFVRALFASARTDVALFVDRHTPGGVAKVSHGGTYRLFVPFFGGPDDRLALDFAVQLCANPKISATVVRVSKAEGEAGEEKPPTLGEGAGAVGDAHAHQNTMTIASAFPDTVYGHATTQTRLMSETADNIAWARYTRPEDPSLIPALARMKFVEEATPAPLHFVIDQARKMSDAAVEEHSRLLVLAGRSRRLAVENHHEEIKTVMEEHGRVGGEVKRTVGDVTTALVVSGCQVNVIVFQAALEPE